MLRTPDHGRASLARTEFERLEEYDDEAVTLSEAKLWAAIDTDDFDVAVFDAIDGVIDLVQEDLNCSLVPRKVTATFESFATETRLPYGPVLDVFSVKRLDMDEEIDIEGFYRRGDSLYFDQVFGYEHPFFRQGLEVIYLAGYHEIPFGIKQGLKQAILTTLNDREDNAMGAVSEIPSNSRRKLMKYRRY
jgi:hypothetical protein